jgi:hypothetical protein
MRVAEFKYFCRRGHLRLPGMSLIGVTLVALAVAVLPVFPGAAGDSSIDVAAWVARWPIQFSVQGGKSEPAYVEAINIDRRDDIFLTVGGAPAWAERQTESVSVAPDGAIRHLICPKAMNCDDTFPGITFLSSASLLAAYRANRPLGRATPVSYGARKIVCIPAERIGVTGAVLDPCFDLETGAVLAQRLRLDGRIDGPSLDPGSIRISSGAKS